MRVLVTGAGGMVGRAGVNHCAARGDEVVARERDALDITDARALEAVFTADRPDAVINCAAWTDVDGCEGDPLRAHRSNAAAVELLAEKARRARSLFVTISTDYVFDGDKPEGFYTQRDDPAPRSVYGIAKLAGERLAQAASARTVVVRTGWIFGAGGKNFLATAIARARRGETLKAIHDAYGTPTYAPHLAARLRELAAQDLPGVYHVVNAGAGASFAEFARAAVALSGRAGAAGVETVAMDSLKRSAPRPRNSRLRCLLSEAVGLAPLPAWPDALAEFAALTEELEKA